MPPHRFILLIATVIAAAGATIWLGAQLQATFGISPWALALPVALAATVGLRWLR